ncbi:response regulator receiver domain [Yersinia pseudotuberculosis]|nr:response regulator receiver domain [Yersinia pseudotuberculosis]
MPTAAFFNSSQKIVQDFLSNVVAVDDNLFFESPKPPVKDEFDEFDDIEKDDSGLGKVATEVSPKISMGNHPLDYQELSVAFSEFGINCCAFRPDIERFNTIEVAAEQITKSARRADITILDWSMDDKFGASPGSLAKSSICKILQDDNYLNGRLRLIIIYTGEPTLQEITGEIHKAVAEIDATAFIENKTVRFKKNSLEFCQITVIDKKDNAEKLRDEAIGLFTTLTAGLLSNATLSAIGELRDQTHHILHTFNNQLDPAYLAHVIGLLSSPQVREKSYEIAFDYATDLISEEIKSSLQISNVIKDNLNLRRLHDWVEYTNPRKNDNFYEIKIGESPEVGLGSARLKELLDYKSDDQLVLTLTTAPAMMKKEAKTLEYFSRRKINLKLKDVDYLSHEALSAIECKRRDLLSLKLHSHLPTIKQGSIVQKGVDYYICMQPLCDSVRIECSTNFIFLKIAVAEIGKKFTHVLRDSEGSFVKFCIKPGSKDIQSFKLLPDNTTNSAKAVYEDSQYRVKYLNDEGQEDYLIWFGELKSNVAQAIANQLAEQISRVGLDTNEWLRRH